MIYKNEIGQTITEENLNKMIANVENERYDDFVDVSDVEYKRIEPRMVDRTTISVQIPTLMKKNWSILQNNINVL